MPDEVPPPAQITEKPTVYTGQWVENREKIKKDTQKNPPRSAINEERLKEIHAELESIRNGQLLSSPRVTDTPDLPEWARPETQLSSENQDTQLIANLVKHPEAIESNIRKLTREQVNHLISVWIDGFPLDKTNEKTIGHMLTQLIEIHPMIVIEELKNIIPSENADDYEHRMIRIHTLITPTLIEAMTEAQRDDLENRLSVKNDKMEMDIITQARFLDLRIGSPKDMDPEEYQEKQEAIDEAIQVYDVIVGDDNRRSLNAQEFIAEACRRVSSKNLGRLSQMIRTAPYLITDLNPFMVDANIDILDSISSDEFEKLFGEGILPGPERMFEIFKLHYPPEVVKDNLNEACSPVLQHADITELEEILHNDLLKASYESGNTSLYQYLKETNESIDLLLSISNGVTLNDMQMEQVRSFIGKIKRTQETPIDPTNIITLQHSISLETVEAIRKGIIEQYVKPIGLASISEAISYMIEAKNTANNRNETFIKNLGSKAAQLQSGDLLKGVDDTFLEEILENGSVPQEFLGHKSDATPYDSDFSRVLADESNSAFQEVIKNSLAYAYGDLILCIKDRGQFQETSRDNLEHATYDQSKYEVFNAAVTLSEHSQHYSIRGGIGANEFDYFIVKGKLANNSEHLENLYAKILKSGRVIPILNEQGTVIYPNGSLANKTQASSV